MAILAHVLQVVAWRIAPLIIFLFKTKVSAPRQRLL
jgi:hypothetical protein